MGTSILRQSKPQISNNADHELGDPRLVKETKEFVVVGPLGHLARMGQRNYLLTSIRDSKNKHTYSKQAFRTTCLRSFSFPRCYAFPIERSAIWRAFIPSMRLIYTAGNITVRSV